MWIHFIMILVKINSQLLFADFYRLAGANLPMEVHFTPARFARAKRKAERARWFW